MVLPVRRPTEAKATRLSSRGRRAGQPPSTVAKGATAANALQRTTTVLIGKAGLTLEGDQLHPVNRNSDIESYGWPTRTATHLHRRAPGLRISLGLLAQVGTASSRTLRRWARAVSSTVYDSFADDYVYNDLPPPPFFVFFLGEVAWCLRRWRLF